MSRIVTIIDWFRSILFEQPRRIPTDTQELISNLQAQLTKAFQRIENLEVNRNHLESRLREAEAQSSLLQS